MAEPKEFIVVEFRVRVIGPTGVNDLALYDMLDRARYIQPMLQRAVESKMFPPFRAEVDEVARVVKSK